MDSYSFIRPGKLKLKGEKTKKNKKHKSKRKTEDKDSRFTDADAHGGWWSVREFKEIMDSVAIQLRVSTCFDSTANPENFPGAYPSSCYLLATDDGMMTIGPPRRQGDSPEPQEIFTAVRLSDTKVAFKTGYAKYLGVSPTSDKLLIATADAMGPNEQFEVVFEGDRAALLASNNCFMTYDTETDLIYFKNQQAKENEMILIRSNQPLSHDPLLDLPKEEREGLAKAEVNYVRKFQSWQDKKLRLSTEEFDSVKRARHSGTLHECLLDRREKMKSDRYCK